MDKAEASGGSADGCTKVIRNFGNGPRTDWTFNDEAMFDIEKLFSEVFGTENLTTIGSLLHQFIGLISLRNLEP